MLGHRHGHGLATFVHQQVQDNSHGLLFWYFPSWKPHPYISAFWPKWTWYLWCCWVKLPVSPNPIWKCIGRRKQSSGPATLSSSGLGYGLPSCWLHLGWSPYCSEAMCFVQVPGSKSKWQSWSNSWKLGAWYTNWWSYFGPAGHLAVLAAICPNAGPQKQSLQLSKGWSSGSGTGQVETMMSKLAAKRKTISDCSVALGVERLLHLMCTCHICGKQMQRIKLNANSRCSVTQCIIKCTWNVWSIFTIMSKHNQ